MIDPAFIKLGIGLIILVSVNIILGSVQAIFEKDFITSRFFKGLAKALIVVICFIAVYGVGLLNPDIVAININGQEVTVLSGIYGIVLIGYAFYAHQVFTKFSNIINGKISVISKDASIEVNSVNKNMENNSDSNNYDNSSHTQ